MNKNLNLWGKMILSPFALSVRHSDSKGERIEGYGHFNVIYNKFFFDGPILRYIFASQKHSGRTVLLNFKKYVYCICGIVFLCTNNLYADLTTEIAYGQAVQQAQQGNWQQAHTQLNQLVTNNPDRPDILYDSGVAAYRLKNFESAQAYFKQVTGNEKSTNELKERAHFNLGNAYAAAKQLQEAIDEYEKVLDINPDNQEAQDNLRIVKEMLEQEKQKQQDQQKKDQEKQEQQDKQKQQDKQQQKQKEDQSQEKEGQKDKDQEQSSDQSREKDQNQSQDDQNGDDNKEQDSSQEHGDENDQEEQEQKESGQEQSQENGSDKGQQQRDQEQESNDDAQGNDSGEQEGNKDNQTDQAGHDTDKHERQGKESPQSKFEDKQSQQNEQNKKDNHQQEPSEKMTESQNASQGTQDQEKKQAQQGHAAVNDQDEKNMNPHERWIAQIMQKQEQSDAQANKAFIKQAINKGGSKQHGQKNW
jgi:Ca-activated chloride channel family protein